jgi:hypothetical protein
VLADTQGCERAATQGDERQESNDQTVAILKSVRFIRALCDIRIGNGTTHLSGLSIEYSRRAIENLGTLIANNLDIHHNDGTDYAGGIFNGPS